MIIICMGRLETIISTPKGNYGEGIVHQSMMQEIVVTADIYNIQSLSDFFIEKKTNPTLDMHMWVANKIYKVYYNDPTWEGDPKKNKKERQNAKIASFLIIYQGGGKALGEMLGVSPEEGDKIIGTYYDAFPEMHEQFPIHKKEALKKGWIQISKVTDKRYFFRDFERMIELQEKALAYYPKDRKATDEEKAAIKEAYPEVKQYWREWGMLKGKLERRSINFPVQGNSADMMKTSLLLTYNSQAFKDKNCFPVLPVHDEKLGYVKDDENIEKNTEEVKNFMIKAAGFTCPNTPMFAVMETGDVWIH